MSTYARNAQATAQLAEAAHAGLLLSRYAPLAVIGRCDDKEHVALLKLAINACGRAKPVYELAYERRCRRLTELPNAQCLELQTDGRLAVGLGNESPLEIGLTLHHVYGVPMIPGEALKGLALRYAKASISKEASGSDEMRTQIVSILFGDTESAGFIEFEDAWIVPISLATPNQGLVLDVMTPHHPNYYNGKLAPPSDQDDPVPLPFLSAAGRFSFALHCEDASADGKEWCAYAAALLTQALTEFTWGVGGKTRGGYGRFISPPQEMPPPAA